MHELMVRKTIEEQLIQNFKKQGDVVRDYFELLLKESESGFVTADDKLTKVDCEKITQFVKELNQVIEFKTASQIIRHGFIIPMELIMAFRQARILKMDLMDIIEMVQDR